MLPTILQHLEHSAKGSVWKNGTMKVFEHTVGCNYSMQHLNSRTAAKVGSIYHVQKTSGSLQGDMHPAWLLAFHFHVYERVELRFDLAKPKP